MSQDSVLNKLCKKEWKSAKELAEEIGINQNTTHTSLRKLLEYNEIEFAYRDGEGKIMDGSKSMFKPFGMVRVFRKL